MKKSKRYVYVVTNVETCDIHVFSKGPGYHVLLKMLMVQSKDTQNIP